MDPVLRLLLPMPARSWATTSLILEVAQVKNGSAINITRLTCSWLLMQT